jgi:hypothetical protein
LKLFLEKRQALKRVALVGLSVLVVCGVMWQYTIANLMRLNIIQERVIVENSTPPRQEIFEKPRSPLVVDDPGRAGIWERNIDDWLSSPKTFFFGRGIDSPHIGNIHQHNALIFILVKTGIVGLLLFILLLFSLFYTLYKIKKFRFTIVPFSALLIVFGICITERLFPNHLFFAFIMVYILSVEQQGEPAHKEIKECKKPENNKQ